MAAYCSNFGQRFDPSFGKLKNIRCTNNDDVMMTKLTISENCAFHSQVVNSWLLSRDHEFTSWMERSMSRQLLGAIVDGMNSYNDFVMMTAP